jgi:hypothetical protein
MSIEKMHKEMLYTSLRVRTEKAGGSGTVLYSGPSDSEDKENYVLTNHHVIEDCIKVDEKWDSMLGRKIRVETKATVRAEVFKYNFLSRNVGQTGLEADIVAYDARLDLALLKLRDIRPLEYIASIYPKENLRDIHIYDEITAVGAQLGVPPISTNGQIVYMDTEIENEKYFMGTYQSIFGSSGGAVFRYSEERDAYEFIGVPARVAVLGSLFSVDVITHLSYFVPIESIYKFLDAWCYEFIYDETKDIQECHERRAKKQADARKTLERMYGIVEGE